MGGDQVSAGVTLQFSVCEDVGSWLIRQYDHGPWSHVDCVLPGGGLLGARDDRVGGAPSGVQIRPNGYINFLRTQRIILPCPETSQEAFYGFLRGQLGKPYDQTAIAGFVFQRDWRETDSWFCSELQGVALESAGIFPHKLATPTAKLTPSGLYLAASVLTDVNT